MKLAEGVSFLAVQGINLYAVLAVDELPGRVVESITAAGIKLHDYRRLVLFGSGGQKLWRTLPKTSPKTSPKQKLNPDHPIDSFSSAIVARFAQQYLQDKAFLQLYPGNIDIPLQQLGIQVGWHHPSPLGIGINSEYGLWFAYRVALLSKKVLPVTKFDDHQSPCLSCTAKPCLSACPAAAVSATEVFNIPDCSRYRLADSSACRSTCLARLACPVASQHRYSDEQTAYHYGRSLQSIKAYVAS